jgi:DNA-binding LacI/PurR family transcriptional regulator
VRRKGEEAARMLLRALNPENGGAGEHRVLETRLVVRRSTAPPRQPSQEVIGDG